MMEMQKGTHGVNQVSLRNLDPKIFRDYLTISNAITKRAGLPPPSRPFKRRSEAQAAKSNKELDEELHSKRTLLKALQVESYSGPQQAWQPIEPQSAPDGPEQFDFGSLKQSYLAMKEFLKENQGPIPGREASTGVSHDTARPLHL